MVTDEEFDDYIDEVAEDDVRIGNWSAPASKVLKSTDPIAYNLAKQDYESSLGKD